ncbi:MAG: nitrilase-related carbon-nitrogen hydrolase [Rhodoluna sp.]|jgi:N-carbamoylputrescine amidase
MKLTQVGKLDSLSRVKAATREPVRIALVQMHWEKDAAKHLENLNNGIELAAKAGAKLVCLPELTLSRYPADQKPSGIPSTIAEELEGPTLNFARSAAEKYGLYIHASLYEKSELADGRGYNVAILVNPEGELIGYTPKTHIPVTAGYYEDKYFAPGPSDPDPYPVYDTELGKLGLPTCWDEWFPEVARAYSLAGAEMLIYPTAIGSEPDHPDFDTAPLWQKVIVANGINSGTFMVVPNRWGNEGALNFYGTSFISDPYGRVLVQASRNEDEVLVADLDLDQRRDWLDLFPFLATRRPDTYEALTRPVANPRVDSGDGIDGGIAGEAQ